MDPDTSMFGMDLDVDERGSLLWVDWGRPQPREPYKTSLRKLADFQRSLSDQDDGAAHFTLAAFVIFIDGKNFVQLSGQDLLAAPDFLDDATFHFMGITFIQYHRRDFHLQARYASPSDGDWTLD